MAIDMGLGIRPRANGVGLRSGVWSVPGIGSCPGTWRKSLVWEGLGRGTFIKKIRLFRLATLALSLVPRPEI
jgi:hypothetical protein